MEQLPSQAQWSAFAVEQPQFARGSGRGDAYERLADAVGKTRVFDGEPVKKVAVPAEGQRGPTPYT